MHSECYVPCTDKEKYLLQLRMEGIVMWEERGKAFPRALADRSETIFHVIQR